MVYGNFGVQTASAMEMIDVTRQLQHVVAESGVNEGLLTVFNPHTTAGVTINEGADPDVQDDLLGALQAIVSQRYPYKHREGNSPSHVMATLTGSSAAICIVDGKLQLGTWQRVFFCEYDGPRNRQLSWQILPG